MSITWRDGATTLTTIAAMLLERAYFHNWDVPLVSSMRWVIVGLVGLTAIGLYFSYVLDHYKSIGWRMTAAVFTLSTLALGCLGLVFVHSDYVVLLMVNAAVFWLASIMRHVSVETPMRQSRI